MAYKNKNKNKKHVHDLHKDDRGKKSRRKAIKKQRNNPTESIEQIFARELAMGNL